ncbi:pentapeptide repeat-containing protein [Nonomuraea antimicrobica]
MIGASLTGSRGTGFKVSRSNLTLANLGGCSLRGEVVEGVRFDDADLSGCDFTEATLSDCRLRGTRLLGAKFAKADLRGADLGEPDDAKLRAFAGAIINQAQANAILAARGITVL